MKRRVPLVACVVAAVGCTKSPQARASAAYETAASWSAVAALTGERWLAGAVPDQYATSTLAKASRELRTAAAKLDSLHQSASVTIVRPAAARADSLRTAIVRGDRRRAAESLSPLQGASARLRAASDSIDRSGE